MRRFVIGVVIVACLVELFFIIKVIRDQPSAADAATPPVASAKATASKPKPKPSSTSLEPSGVQRLRLTTNGLIIRSWRGSCSEPGRTRLQISPNGGRSFDEIALPILDKGSKAPGVRALLSIEAPTRENITIVGADRNCATATYQTANGGTTWTQLDRPVGWYVSAASREVGFDDEVSVPGCTVQRVAPVNDQNAKVLCDDGSIRGTNDTGAQWDVLGRLNGGIDISFTTLRDGLGLTAAPDCAAQLVTTANAGNEWDDVSCVVKKSPGRAESMIARGSLVVVQVAGEIYRSTDAGETWVKAGQE